MAPPSSRHHLEDTPTDAIETREPFGVLAVPVARLLLLAKLARVERPPPIVLLRWRRWLPCGRLLAGPRLDTLGAIGVRPPATAGSGRVVASVGRTPSPAPASAPNPATVLPAPPPALRVALREPLTTG